MDFIINSEKLVNSSHDSSTNVINEHFRNSNSTEAMPHLSRENQPPFTEDSSVSSTYSPHSRSLSLSVASALKTRSSLRTSKSTVLRKRLLIDDHFHRESFCEEKDKREKKDLCPSQASNSSANEEVVKVTDAPTLDLACLIHIEPPQVKDFPEVIRPHIEVKNILKQTNFMMQLHCDQQKILNSSLLQKITEEESVIDVTSRSKRQYDENKQYVSKESQTIPVKILPISEDDGITDKKVKNKVEFDEIKILDKETQTPGPKARTKNHSDVMAQSKDKETTEVQVESSLKTMNSELADNNLSEEYWGDVYNDYKKQIAENANKMQAFKNDQNKFFKAGHVEKLNSYIGGDVSKKTLNGTAVKKTNILMKPTIISPNLKKQTKPNMKGEDEDIYTDNENFRKFYEVPQFDELAKSYLTPSDRRVKAVCTKIGCKIRMYGPIIRWNSEESHQLHPPSRVKTFYYVTIGARTKDRLDKAIKCIQETYPKTYLSEKFNTLPLVENLGTEIPI